MAVVVVVETDCVNLCFCDRQEYELRDSNLVMGNISVEEEMQLKNQEH